MVAAERLIDLANASGGPDNITAIIIKVSDEAPPTAGYGSQNQAPLAFDENTPVPKHDKPSTLPEGPSTVPEGPSTLPEGDI